MKTTACVLEKLMFVLAPGIQANQFFFTKEGGGGGGAGGYLSICTYFIQKDDLSLIFDPTLSFADTRGSLQHDGWHFPVMIWVNCCKYFANEYYLRYSLLKELAQP